MTWQEMQAGELDWWRTYLRRINALPRLFALYGYRYLSFFFEEFNNLGRVIDFGSGPVSAAHIADLDPGPVPCVDSLFARYREDGMMFGEAVDVPDGGAGGEYDTALVFNVLDHTENPAALLVAVAVSLKPGGRALLWVHVDAPADALHRTVTEDEVRRWVRDAGLEILRETRRRRGHGGPDEYLMVAINE